MRRARDVLHQVDILPSHLVAHERALRFAHTFTHSWFWRCIMLEMISSTSAPLLRSVLSHHLWTLSESLLGTLTSAPVYALTDADQHPVDFTNVCAY